jgi:large subunit ribosomal protein L19
MANSFIYHDQTLHVGDTIAVAQKIVEDSKTRLQTFEGVLIAVTGKDTGKAFRVRKLSHLNIGVERLWPVQSPLIASITLKKKGSVRRAKLYYLRHRVGKQALATGTPATTPTKTPKLKTSQKGKRN